MSMSALEIDWYFADPYSAWEPVCMKYKWLNQKIIKE